MQQISGDGDLVGTPGSLRPAGRPPSGPPSGRPPSLDALTGLRFFAAMQVVLFHWDRVFALPLAGPLANVVHAGFVGVSVFFPLSGFILAYNYLPAPGRPVDRGRFWIARVARIYPVYLLGLLVYLPFYLRDTPKALGRLGTVFVGVTSVTLTQSVAQQDPGWNLPGWSLSAEVFFYALFPFAVTLLLRAKPRRMIVMAIALWCASMALTITYSVLYPGVRAVENYAGITFIKFNPLARVPEFLIGVLVGLLFRSGSIAVGKRHSSSLALLCVAVVAGILVASPRIPFAILHDSLLTPVIVVLLLALATGRGTLARALSSAGIRRLGEASYAIYILHVPLLLWMVKVADKAGLIPLLERHHMLFLIPYVVLVVVSSLVVFHVVEQPSRRIVTQRLTTVFGRIRGRVSLHEA